MTEERAKTKWCPFVKIVIGPNDPSWQGEMLSNRGDAVTSKESLNCLGYRCMAWRSDAFSNGYCGLVGR